MNLNVSNYIERINYSGKLEPTLEVLKALQRQHLLSIPFENLDIHYGIPIMLNIEAIYTKIIKNNRGGFCYELNGLFYNLLLEIGFDVKYLSAKVHTNDNQYGPEFDHLTLLVTINNIEYLTDVGFGEFIFEPLQLDINKLQEDERGNYIIENYGQHFFLFKYQGSYDYISQKYDFEIIKGISEEK